MTDPALAAHGDPAASRRDRLFLAAAMLLGLAIIVVDTLSVVDDRAKSGRPIALWEPLVWESTSVLGIVLLAPLVMALTRRFPPLVRSWPQVVGAHLAGAAAFSLVHVASMGLLRWAVYAAVGGYYAPLAPIGEFPYELRKDLLTYMSLVVAYAVWLRLQAQQGPALDLPEAIEVRDGARRRFIPYAEVAGIEAAGNYVELHTAAGAVLHRASLSDMEGRLRDHGFVRIHRSRLVRRAAVAQVESKPSGDFVVRLVDGRELGGSRRYRRPLLEP